MCREDYGSISRVNERDYHPFGGDSSLRRANEDDDAEPYHFESPAVSSSTQDHLPRNRRDRDRDDQLEVDHVLFQIGLDRLDELDPDQDEQEHSEEVEEFVVLQQVDRRREEPLDRDDDQGDQREPDHHQEEQKEYRVDSPFKPVHEVYHPVRSVGGRVHNQNGIQNV